MLASKTLAALAFLLPAVSAGSGTAQIYVEKNGNTNIGCLNEVGKWVSFGDSCATFNYDEDAVYFPSSGDYCSLNHGPNNLVTCSSDVDESDQYSSFEAYINLEIGNLLQSQEGSGSGFDFFAEGSSPTADGVNIKAENFDGSYTVNLLMNYLS